MEKIVWITTAVLFALGLIIAYIVVLEKRLQIIERRLKK